MTAVRLCQVILLQSLNVLQQNKMCESFSATADSNRLLQLLYKGKISASHITGFGYKGVACITVRYPVYFIPYAFCAVAEVGSSYGIKEHQPAAVQVRAKCSLQSGNRISQILFISETHSLNNTIYPVNQIPVGFQTILQIRFDLCINLLQLRGSFLNSLLTHIGSDK